MSADFWDLVSPCPITGCYWWLGTYEESGYGRFGPTSSARRYGRETYAHRVAWTLVHGPVPKGAVLRHRCDQRACVNAWTHIEPGSDEQNMRDRDSRGRNGHAVLSPATVAVIKRDLAHGVRGSELARIHGVAPLVISKIKRGRTWAWVKEVA